MYYGMITLAAVFLALGMSSQRFYQKQAGASRKSVLLYSAVRSGITALIFLAVNGFRMECTPYSLAMAALMALLCVVYTVMGFEILEQGGVTLYSLFIMSGGMLVPYSWGVLFLEEPFSAIRSVGLVLILISVVLSNTGGGKKTPAMVIACLVVFFLNGFVGVISKEHQIHTDLAVSSVGYMVLVNILRSAMSFAALLPRKMRSQPGSLTTGQILGNKKVLLILPVAAALEGVCYFLQIVSAANLPATAMFPFLTGGGLVFSALAGMILFREKPTRRVLVGVAICFVGTLLFLWE